MEQLIFFLTIFSYIYYTQISTNVNRWVMTKSQKNLLIFVFILTIINFIAIITLNFKLEDCMGAIDILIDFIGK